MRSRALLATVAGTAAGLVAVSVVAGPGVASAGTGHVLKAHEKFTATYVQDLDPKGTSMGDRLAFASVLRDLKGVKIADSGGDCVVVKGTNDTNAVYHCTQSYRFDGGAQLVVGGIFTFANKNGALAILGGTGKYRHTRGEATYTTLSADSFADTFHFDS